MPVTGVAADTGQLSVLAPSDGYPWGCDCENPAAAAGLNEESAKEFKDGYGE